MFWWLLGSWLFIVSFIWFLFYGASLYDRRNTTARHSWNYPLKLEAPPSDYKGDPVVAGE